VEPHTDHRSIQHSFRYPIRSTGPTSDKLPDALTLSRLPDSVLSYQLLLTSVLFALISFSALHAAKLHSNKCRPTTTTTTTPAATATPATNVTSPAAGSDRLHGSWTCICERSRLATECRECGGPGRSEEKVALRPGPHRRTGHQENEIETVTSPEMSDCASNILCMCSLPTCIFLDSIQL